jgi:DNA-binding transcriptional ArsR family regulator
VKPLFHPSIDDITVEGILHALSDPTRVAMFAQIAASNGEHTCSSVQKVIEKPIPKSTLSVHFKALREAGLIRSERQGVEMRNTARCADVERRFPGLLQAIVDAHKRQTATSTAAKPASANGRRRARR